MSFPKTHLDKFFIQISSISVLKKNILLKKYFHLKIIRIMLKAFVSKFILNVYQYANQRKIAPKIIQNGTKKIIFLHKAPPPPHPPMGIVLLLWSLGELLESERNKIMKQNIKSYSFPRKQKASTQKGLTNFSKATS